MRQSVNTMNTRYWHIPSFVATKPGQENLTR